MSHPDYAQYSGGQFPSGYGFPLPPQKSTAGRKFLITLVVLALLAGAGYWAKTTYLDKKDSDATAESTGPTQLGAPGAPAPVPAPDQGLGPAASSLPGAINLPPEVSPGQVATGGVDQYLRTAKALFPQYDDQTRLNMGQRACDLLATATGTPDALWAAIAADQDLLPSKGAALAEVATANLCPQYRSKVFADGAAAAPAAPAPAAPAPAAPAPAAPAPAAPAPAAPAPAPAGTPGATYTIPGGPGWEVEAGCLAAGKSPEECRARRAERYPSAPTAPAPGAGG